MKTDKPEKEKRIFMTESAELLAIKDTLASLRILLPIVAFLQVILIVTWFLDMTGDRYARGGLIYVAGYIFLFLASIVVSLIFRKYSENISENRRRIFHTQMTYAWMLPSWAAVLTMMDAINGSYTFGIQLYVITNVLTIGICYMNIGKWTMIQCTTGLAILIAAFIMPMTEHFTFVSELIAYLIISIVAGRFVFQMKTNNYERQAKLSDLLNRVEYDSLTGVYTREAFYRKVEELLESDPDTPYTLIASDIDNFKQINSIYGNSKGNDVLCYLAREFKKYGRLTARYGSDQFIYIFPSSDKLPKQELFNVITKIADCAPVRNLTVKYGYYDIGKDKLPVSTMCDRALLAAKSIRHNYARKIACYDGPVGRQYALNQLYESGFNDAIKSHQFVVWYQPQHDAVTHEICSAEALIRWQDENGNLIPPGMFIPIFEKDGLITRLDYYVFESVCRIQRCRLEAGLKPISISVNISKATLHESELTEKLKSILTEYQVPIGLVPLEVTESQEISLTEFRELVDTLKADGFDIHLDDFGSGYATLNTINTLPFAVLKLDKTLIDDIQSEGGKELIRHIIEFSHFRNMQVIAEGVEKKEQLDFLIRTKCNLIQGYYFNRPMPYDQFTALLDRKLKQYLPAASRPDQADLVRAT